MGPRPNLSYEYKGYIPEWGWRVIREKLIKLDAEEKITWSNSGRPYLKRYLHEQKGTPIKSVITDIQPLSAQAGEKLGYPTQKPLALLERIILASSNPGDLCLDPFCGCGTAIAACQKLDRRWIGIDITHLAINLQKYRLRDSFQLEPRRDYLVIGEPVDLASARNLARDNRYQFQWWALSLIGARPYGGESGARTGKKGKDHGVDGLISFLDGPKNKLQTALVQVKSGKVGSQLVRDLRGAVERENAALGIFISLEKPTEDMRREALSAGYYTSPLWNKDYPRLQLYTIEQLLSGSQVEMPPTQATYKKAGRIRKNQGEQTKLEF